MQSVTKYCSIKGIVQEALTYKKALFKGNMVAIIATLLTVVIPLFIPMLVDELLLKKSNTMTGWIAEHFGTMSVSGYIMLFLILTLILRSLGFLLNVVQVRTFLGISKDLSLKLRKKAIDHLERVTLKEYELVSPGAITSKLVTDVNTIDSFIGTTISKFIISVLTLVFISIVLLMIHWKLAIFILVTNPIVVFYTSKLARGIGKLKKEENQSTEEFQSSLNDTLSLFRQIKASNKEGYFFSIIEDKAQYLKDVSVEFGYRSDKAIRMSFLVFLSGYEIFRSVGIWAVAYSDLSVGLMLAIFGYLWVMMTPTQDIINFQYALSNAKASCKRINGIFDMQEEPVVVNSKNPFIADEPVDIEVRDLSFSYNVGQNILNNINMKIPKYSKIAIVGASGSGKTTLANLLVGFYSATSGEIVYDNVSSKEVELSTIRANSHLILQHPKLFNDTLYFNLTLGDVHSDEDVTRAIEISQLSDVVDNLSDGIDTIVGNDGIKLSGGQRQRVSIARMILMNPMIVILDESTSALDIHTETKVFDGLKEYLKNRTVITIAHRLSTIQSAEYIYVLESGRVVDSGTPAELIAKDESYFSLMV